ncbi:MAG: hypothetical protein IJ309_00375 [Clostridia bacterium]|nr:hypothetical protein [Clostridia bacterium]
MFGYIKPVIPELKVRDHELYKAIYCGLCKTMGKRTGCMSNVTLSYDFVFLALLRSALTEQKGEVRLRRCAMHPFKKRPILEPNPCLEYCAEASTILTRLKLKDNINDSHGFKRFKAKIAGGVSVFLKKTGKELIPLEEEISSLIDELSALEKAKEDSIDKVANVFGRLLGRVADYGLSGSQAKIAYSIGYHLGKWIYVIDAYDDFYDDVKTGSYNPLVNAYGTSLDDSIRSALKDALTMELSKMSMAIDLVDFSQNRDIQRVVENIIYIGMPKEFERITEDRK